MHFDILEAYLSTLFGNFFWLHNNFGGRNMTGWDNERKHGQADFSQEYVLNITLKTFQESLMKNLLKIETIPQTLKLFIKTRLSVK